MTHFSKEDWQHYVKNELNDDVREEFEAHLYSCSQCLDLYLLTVAERENELPMISNEIGFTDQIMLEIAKWKEAEPGEDAPKTNTGKLIPLKQSDKKAKPFYQTAVFHYFLAAAMTLLLMAAGVFQSMTKYTETVEGSNLQEKQPSVTEGIIDKTFAWMDSIDLKNKEANK